MHPPPDSGKPGHMAGLPCRIVLKGDVSERFAPALHGLRCTVNLAVPSCAERSPTNRSFRASSTGSSTWAYSWSASPSEKNAPARSLLRRLTATPEGSGAVITPRSSPPLRGSRSTRAVMAGGHHPGPASDCSAVKTQRTWHDRIRENTDCAADADDHCQARDRPGVPAAQASRAAAENS